MLRRRGRYAVAVLAGLPVTDRDGRPVRVVLLGRSGCHLCEVAGEVVGAVCDRAGVGWVERDLDALPELLATYATKIPVVFVDGREHSVWRVDPGRLERALGR